MTEPSELIPLDHAATTPLALGVFEAMRPWLMGVQANPASDHVAGRAARAAVEAARTEVARLIGASAENVVWTSGATESINLAIKGALEFYGGDKVHIVSSRIEHRATLDTLRWLTGQGHRVTLLTPDTQGHITPDAVMAALSPDTRLVSLMWVNNEIGCVTDIPAIAQSLRARGVLLHVDAAQAAGWLPINVAEVPIDLMSLSAHKLGGPKGIGALYVCRRPRVRLSPMLHGGGQEQGMRSGTLPTHQIAGFGAAAARRYAHRAALATSVSLLREQLWSRLAEAIPGIIRNSPATGSPHILNVSVPGVDGESLRASLPSLLFSSGSACSSATREPSFVLRALGHGDALADASLRLSLGEDSEAPQISRAAALIAGAVSRLRAVAAGIVPADVGLDNHFGYSTVVWKRFVALSGVGRAVQSAGLSARVASRSDGAWLAVSVVTTGQQITTVMFSGQGCPVTLAAGQWFSEQLSNADVSVLNQNWVAATVAALEIVPEKAHCAVMIDDLARALLARFSSQPECPV